MLVKTAFGLLPDLKTVGTVEFGLLITPINTKIGGMITLENTHFRPTLLGTVFTFEDGDEAMITDQTVDEIFIESSEFVGWIPTAVFWERLGVEE